MLFKLSSKLTYCRQEMNKRRHDSGWDRVWGARGEEKASAKMLLTEGQNLAVLFRVAQGLCASSFTSG